MKAWIITLLPLAFFVGYFVADLILEKIGNIKIEIKLK